MNNRTIKRIANKAILAIIVAVSYVSEEQAWNILLHVLKKRYRKEIRAAKQQSL